MWPITAQSTPVYDGWGWDDYWMPGDWIRWHQLMAAEYGLTEANQRMVYAYNQGSTGAAHFSWRTFDSEFRDYAKRNGFYSGLFGGAGFIMQPIAGTVTVLENAGEVVTEIAETAADAAGWLKPLLVIGMVIVLIFIAINLSRSYA